MIFTIEVHEPVVVFVIHASLENKVVSHQNIYIYVIKCL